MADFIPSTSASQSADGLTVTFIDSSDYINNNQGYTKSDFTTNTLVIKDAYGEVLQTSSFLYTDTITYKQTSDHWFTTERVLAGIADYSRTQKFPLRRITTNKMETVLGSGCCQGATNAKNLCEANAYVIGAIDAAPSGNSVAWQRFIDAANSFLNLILNG